MMAGAVVATIPPMALFVAAQRYVVEEVVLSRIKGWVPGRGRRGMGSAARGYR